MISGDTKQACAARRRRLERALGEGAAPALIAAGGRRPRSSLRTTYPYRPSSHFRYFVGAGVEGALLWIGDGEACLFRAEPGDLFDEQALYYGRPMEGFILSAHLGLRVRPLEALPAAIAGRSVACLPPLDEGERRALAALLGRAPEGLGREALDEPLLDAVVELRLNQDEAAVEGLRHAAAVTARAQLAAMAATRAGDLERDAAAAAEAVLCAEGCAAAYEPVVTTRGDLLRDARRARPLHHGDLLLCDLGVEGPGGWASKRTRTWPIGGRFSGPQRALYELVLAARQACLERLRPGVPFGDVHLAAARVITQGLVDEGLLRGEVDSLLETGAYGLFFPHGAGQLLGLDVCDMEDLGERAGFGKDWARPGGFPGRFFQLGRALRAGMALTLEPGVYMVEELLVAPQRAGLPADMFDRDKLARFGDVRGVRVGDGVLLGEGGSEQLGADLPTAVEDVEAAVGG